MVFVETLDHTAAGQRRLYLAHMDCRPSNGFMVAWNFGSWCFSPARSYY
jgi:hypothetical protein